MNAVGVIASGGHSVVHRQKHISNFRHHEIKSGQGVQLPGPAGFLLHQNGDVLIEQVENQDHGADEQPVEHIVQKDRHRIQMVDSINRDPVKNQMQQHHHQQHGKGMVELGEFLFRGKIGISHKPDHQKQSDFHSEHCASLLCTPHVKIYYKSSPLKMIA